MEAARRAELVRRGLDMLKHGEAVLILGPNLFNFMLDHDVPCVLQQPIPRDPNAQIYKRVLR